LCAGLTTCLEAAKKALTEERSAWQTTDQELWTAQDSATSLNWELLSKVAALEDLIEREKAAQDALRALANEKCVLEQELSSTRKMFVERDTSSSKGMALAMAHSVGLLRSHVPDLDPKLLHEDY
jgi:hypothetical protein